VGYVPNALDHLTERDEWLNARIQADIESLKDIGLNAELVDLKAYFGSEDRLEAKLEELDGVWVSGGNVFILRQAMKLSGFDSIVWRFGEKASFVYGGYSAGCCVLSKTLTPYQKASDPTARAYKAIDHVLWDGLGLIDFAFMPHYKSDHSESERIEQEIEYCRENQIPYRTVRDGEVLVF